MTAFIFEGEIAAKPGERLVVLPKGLKDKKTLLEFLHHAIPLPHYFGGNWDALEECLGDLAWLPDEKLVLVHEDIPLGTTPSDQQTYLQVLANAAWEEKRLSVVFSNHSRTEIERIFGIAG
jgi:hypothetical protein